MPTGPPDSCLLHWRTILRMAPSPLSSLFMAPSQTRLGLSGGMWPQSKEVEVRGPMKSLRTFSRSRRRSRMLPASFFCPPSHSTASASWPKGANAMLDSVCGGSHTAFIAQTGVAAGIVLRAIQDARRLIKGAASATNSEPSRYLRTPAVPLSRRIQG